MERIAVFTWASFLWFTSFHTSSSIMVTDKRNMVLESIDVAEEVDFVSSQKTSSWRKMMLRRVMVLP